MCLADLATPTMDLETFLWHLRKASREKPFNVSLTGIRNALGECPITAVARYVTGQRYPNNSYKKAAQMLGLEGDLSLKIAAAADCCFSCHKEVRSRLIAACRIENDFPTLDEKKNFYFGTAADSLAFKLMQLKGLEKTHTFLVSMSDPVQELVSA